MRVISPISLEQEPKKEDSSSDKPKESLSFLEKLKYFKEILKYGTICFVSLVLLVAYLGFQDELEDLLTRNLQKSGAMVEEYKFVDTELYEKRNVDSANSNFLKKHFCRGGAKSSFC